MLLSVMYPLTCKGDCVCQHINKKSVFWVGANFNTYFPTVVSTTNIKAMLGNVKKSDTRKETLAHV